MFIQASYSLRRCFAFLQAANLSASWNILSQTAIQKFRKLEILIYQQPMRDRSWPRVSCADWPMITPSSHPYVVCWADHWPPPRPPLCPLPLSCSLDQCLRLTSGQHMLSSDLPAHIPNSMSLFVSWSPTPLSPHLSPPNMSSSSQAPGYQAIQMQMTTGWVLYWLYTNCNN